MHSIRLRGPWELALPGSAEVQRIELPAPWKIPGKLSTAPSPARLSRRFGMPSGIAAGDRLCLVIESTGATCQVELNGQLLGTMKPAEMSASFAVTELLLPRNELVILLEIPRPQAALAEVSGPFRDVRLEIIPAG